VPYILRKVAQHASGPSITMNCVQVLKMVNYHESLMNINFSGFTYRMLAAPRGNEMPMRIHCFAHCKIPVKAVVTVVPYTEDVSVGHLCGTSLTTGEVAFFTL
jgi:hypothetical protein